MLKVYDYQCQKCNTTLEYLKHDSEPDPICDNCEVRLVKVLSPTKGKVIGSTTPVKQ